MPGGRREIGTLGEKVAADYLRKLGYKIRETNFRCREGEIDIVAQDEDCLAFVEVRTRTSPEFGTPEESVTPAKQDKLVSLALAYLQSNRKLPSLWRIDVVAVEMGRDRTVTRIELTQNVTG